VRIKGGDSLETRFLSFYRKAIQTKQDDPISFNQFWKRIEDEITGKKTVYISPDGVYNQLNVNTIMGPDRNTDYPA